MSYPNMNWQQIDSLIKQAHKTVQCGEGGITLIFGSQRETARKRLDNRRIRNKLALKSATEFFP